MNRENIVKEYDTSSDEIVLGELFYALLKKWWLLIICTIGGGLLALVVTLKIITPMYQSQAVMYMLAENTSITSLTELQVGTELAADFSKIVTSKPVVDSAIKEIKKESNKSFSREEVLASVVVTNTASRMLTITSTCADPEDACLIANAIAEAAANQVAEITKSDPPYIVEHAEVSLEPISPSVPKNILKGLLLGFALAAAFIVVRYILNENIQSEEDIERVLGLPTLAVVPKMCKEKRPYARAGKDEAKS